VSDNFRAVQHIDCRAMIEARLGQDGSASLAETVSAHAHTSRVTTTSRFIVVLPVYRWSTHARAHHSSAWNHAHVVMTWTMTSYGSIPPAKLKSRWLNCSEVIPELETLQNKILFSFTVGSKQLSWKRFRWLSLAPTVDWVIVLMYHVFLVYQGSAATHLRWGGKFRSSLLRLSSPNVITKE